MSKAEWKLSCRQPEYVLMSSDYSQQEPKLTAFVSGDSKMIQAFKDGKDIYATIAGLSFGLPYEKCLEFHPDTGEYQPDGKARRGEAKTIVLGITYGRSVVTIADQLFGKDTTLTDEQKTQKAQKVYDSVLEAFPDLKTFMNSAQAHARKYGYVCTILGRRRHIPDMQLPPYEFRAMKGYVNPDVDPLDVNTLSNADEIPQRVVDALTEEFKSYKYFGQAAKRIKELAEDYHIRVINNRSKINDATRTCVNSIIQGSAAEQTKMAMLLIDNDPEWNRIGGRILVPIHDEILAEVPIQYAEKGGEILSGLMCKAADFLPYKSKCDVETSYRWYGMEYPCPYDQPASMDSETWTESQIKWVQYHLVEAEYSLPVIKGPDGEKPRGDAAKGVNGVITDNMLHAMRSYMNRYNIREDMFIDHIKKTCEKGVYI